MLSRIIRYLPPTLRHSLRKVFGDDRAVIAPTYALVFLTMIMALGVGTDISNGLQAKYQLDLAADAAAVACGETWQAYMEAGAGIATSSSDVTTLVNLANTRAQQAGVSAFLAQSALLGVTGPTNPSFSSPTILVPVSGSTTIPGVVASEPSNTLNILKCQVNYSAKNLNYLMQIVGFRALTVNGQSQSAVILPPYVAVYLIVDTSSSMMVGSTAGDSELIANWVRGSVTTGSGRSRVTTYNACQVFGGTGTCSNNRTCGFACHDATESSINDMLNMKTFGETVAQYVGAKTRFDVMRLALVNDTSASPDPNYCTTTSTAPTSDPVYASQTAAPTPVQCNSVNGKGLLAYIRDTYQVPNARQNLNTFTYSLYGFNEGINGLYEPFTGSNDYSQYAVPTGSTNQQDAPFGLQSLSQIAEGVNNLMLGDNTHLNDRVLPEIINGGNGIVKPTTTNGCPAGTCPSNPLKFIIFVTDGLNSDRGSNWDGNASDQYTTSQLTNTFCSNWAGNPTPFYPGTIIPLWTIVAPNNVGECGNPNYSPGFFGTPTGVQTFSPSTSTYVDKPLASRSFPAGIDTTQCATLKANGGGNNALPLYGTIYGTTIAVLETPYVPLNGQDPGTWPYERTVQTTIYPSGPTGSGLPPNSPNHISNNLATCATTTPNNTTFYFQATSDSQIANGFVTLFDTYVGQWVHLTQ